MSDPGSRLEGSQSDAQAEIDQLNKMISALMDRAERRSGVQESDFSQFQDTILLEKEVKQRTSELEIALHENEKIMRALKESEARFRGVVSQSLIGIVIIDGDAFSYANAKFAEIFGYDADEVLLLGPMETVCAADRARVKESLRQRQNREADHDQFTFTGLCKDGSAIDIECHASALEVGGQRLLISLVLDITDRVRSEREVQELQRRLQDQSIHDALTGLFNRRYLDEYLERELARANSAGIPVSVIMIDLDWFKAINDRFGHQAGDEVLRGLALTIRDSTRPSDVCCRYGGEEFLVILPGMSADSALLRAENIRTDIMLNSIPFEGEVITMTTSFGVASSPQSGRSADDLVASADAALYAAKETGRNNVRQARTPQESSNEIAAH